MMIRKLDNLINDLEKANKRLKEAAELKPTRIHKDAAIQRFEFTFELSWKTIQEYIRDQGLDCRSPKNCFRKGEEAGIIENLNNWFKYLEARNFIAHTYSEKLSNKIYKEAIKFPKEVAKLLERLKEG